MQSKIGTEGRGQSGEDACSYIEPAPEEDEQRQAGVIWASFTLRIGEDVKDTLYMPFDCFSPKPISKLRIFHLYLWIIYKYNTEI